MKKQLFLRNGKSIDLNANIGYIVQEKNNLKEFSIHHPGYFPNFALANKFYKEETEKGLEYERPVAYTIESEFIKTRSRFKMRGGFGAQERAAQMVYDLYFAPGKRFFKRNFK